MNSLLLSSLFLWALDPPPIGSICATFWALCIKYHYICILLYFSWRPFWHIWLNSQLIPVTSIRFRVRVNVWHFVGADMLLDIQYQLMEMNGHRQHVLFKCNLLCCAVFSSHIPQMPANTLYTPSCTIHKPKDYWCFLNQLLQQKAADCWNSEFDQKNEHCEEKNNGKV